MILLDSSIMRSQSVPNGAGVVMLRLLAKSAGHELGLPEVVRDEYLSHHRRTLERNIQAARKAVTELIGCCAPWDGQNSWQTLTYPNVDESCERLQRTLEETFVIVPATEDTLRQALRREAFRLPPAKTGDNAGGARDAAIWLTAIASCRTASPAQVFFVAADGGDFGKGNLRAELAKEAPDNLVYCYGIDEVLRNLADPTELPEGEPDAVLRTNNVKDAVAKSLSSSDVFFELTTRIPDAAAGSTVRSAGRSELALAADPDPKKVHAYQVGDNLAVTAELRWAGTRQYVVTDGSGGLGWHVTFEVATTVVVMMRGNGALEQCYVAHRMPIGIVNTARLSGGTTLDLLLGD